MKTMAQVVLCSCIIFFVCGCDKVKAAKDRAAALTCEGHKGVEGYKPKMDKLEVKCKDGTLITVKYLP